MKSTAETMEALLNVPGTLTPTEQQAAVITRAPFIREGTEELPAPLLVVAGAGSGKTETISMRAAFIAAHYDIPGSDFLGLTFTRKAAAELQERLEQWLGAITPGGAAGDTIDAFAVGDAPEATTYNGFALSVVREFGSQLGLETNAAHLDAAAAWQMMYEIVSTLGKGRITGDGSITTTVDRALNLRESILNQGYTLAGARMKLQALQDQFDLNASERLSLAASAGKKSPAYPRFLEEGRTTNQIRLDLLDVIDAFEDRKRQENRMDFADQVIQATRIVSELPEARNELRRRHRIVFLDEFQDTSVSQMNFLSKLFGDHPVTAVGDPNQAIYGWRGASAGSLSAFPASFATQPGVSAKVLPLTTAWRNDKLVLDVANRISQPFRPSPDAPSGKPEVTVPKLDPRDGAGKGFVDTRYFATIQEQIDSLTDEIKELRDRAKRAAFADQGRHGDNSAPKYPTVAVLTRRRQPISDVLASLAAAGIPAETVGSDGLLAHPAVLDLRAALSVTHEVGRNSQMLRLLTNLDLGASDLWQLSRLARELARKDTTEGHPVTVLLDAVDYLVHNDPPQSISDVGRRRLRTLGRQLQSLRQASDRELSEQVELARRVFYIEEDSLATGANADVTEVLDAFTDTAIEYQTSNPRGTMGGYLSWLDAAEDKERGLSMPRVTPDKGAVQVMTIHASKGLEWDHVYVIDLEEGRFPNHRSGAGKFTDHPDGTVSVEPPEGAAPQYGWWKDPGTLPYPARQDSRYLPDPNIWDPELGAKAAEGLFREEVGAYLLEEERRLAYVAFTRARRKMVLLGSWTSGAATRRVPSVFLKEATEVSGVATTDVPIPTGEQAKALVIAEAAVPYPKEPGPVRKRVALAAANVRSQLAYVRAVSNEEILASVENPKWAQAAQVLLQEHREAATKKQRPPLDNAIDQARSALQGAARFSATRLHQAVSSDEIWLDLRRPVPTEPPVGAALGTVFHAWVEQELRRSSAYRIDADDIQSETDEYEVDRAAPDGFGEDIPGADFDWQDIAPSGTGTRATAEKLLQLQTSFRTIPWIHTATPEGVEIPFTARLWGVTVPGRVDAVFTSPDGKETWLVDWKTGRLQGNGKNQDHLEQYLTQLGVYKEAWKQLSPNSPRIKPMLVFIQDTGIQEYDYEQLASMYQAQTGEEWSLEKRIKALTARLNGQSSPKGPTPQLASRPPTQAPQKSVTPEDQQ